MAKKILIVDDEQSIAEMLEMRLEAMGYETDMAHDGEEALKKVKEFKPELIILDIMMPKVDGLEVCRILKGSPETQDIKVMMVTALGRADDKQRGAEVKADLYMTKPFDSVELMDKVQELLGD
ncbi:MAG: response regulator [Candidatus Omnitrophica bacterium]|nr:response regulator [Candidatus Omnitrophota bacterium]